MIRNKPITLVLCAISLILLGICGIFKMGYKNQSVAQAKTEAIESTNVEVVSDWAMNNRIRYRTIKIGPMICIEAIYENQYELECSPGF